jgi:hypothetical protein
LSKIEAEHKAEEEKLQKKAMPEAEQRLENERLKAEAEKKGNRSQKS